jgi:Uma2 family endonuclease
MSEKWTYDDLALLPEDGLRHEIIDGVLYVNASAITKYQMPLYRLVLAISKYLEEHPLVHLFFAPLDILSQYDIVDRDLMFISNKRHEIVLLNNIQGAPDLVIEILTESDNGHDEVAKCSVYEQMSVSEYWIVDPTRHVVCVFRRNTAGRYERAAKLSSRDTLTSSLFPAFAIDVDRIFAAYR